MQELFLPSLAHWKHGNDWSGSSGRVRYFVITSQEEMLAEVWNEDVSHELAEVKACAGFPVTEEGLEGMRAWLVEQLAALG